ncbi:methionyl-tRNA formyltransferase [Candidatus Giovannonibacteria bacterium RIFCSPHIGHO2_02_43_13]|uniref:Methionyl-tRNA formyltransferase n=1 Tax=Candidatus Giovannonibacteria bacterium RIFCSPHIGHO2_02_43_13 TaxID=1798330 RepID=A0A1F5WPV5_9BACT|nr:MAG: Methionyl-tRNA formyltransferase [Parcubacteria group bacterium GW2011_GWA2_44_13]OGF72523.1 MAG: methionyl-tRNA formyltransferase [Candidatus Giovannonibacteria bacterium RIFCSPHIGHO2_12_FULL_44_42]OGF77688.1 MAG: methionyl-tRNA formyltransferase [Candidatus Giovannonibacteria bacterium RIFCSPHIGHO2_02_43_13]OGF88966.1 MAG: methionyl-tRNA formyltransferase [Candidatus Giovannonibacteria bacterium RIFCSPLOWO2_02_FULL_43_54]OGF97402.1 MAG: methionyl-tRNA formyltransferase [Candidatus Gio
MPKIVFFGTSEFAVPALKALIKNGMPPAAVVTSPDRPAGRKKKLRTSPVKSWIIEYEAYNEKLIQPEKLDHDFILRVSNLMPNIGIIAAYGKILPKELIDIFPQGILNIHSSLLPKYRGASPIQSAILNGDSETGVSIILLDEKTDHGSIVAKREFSILNSQFSITYTQLHDALAELGAELLFETIPKWMNGEIIPHPQDDSRATFTKLIKKEDGRIDWSKNAEEIEKMVRAYNPWPGTFTDAGGKKLKIIKAAVIDAPQSIKPGKFFKSGGFPAIACGKDALKLLIVQPESKKEMAGNAYLLGHPNLLDSAS